MQEGKIIAWALFCRSDSELNYAFYGDDALLLAIVWEMSGWEHHAPLLTNLRKMPSPETIRRTRQKLVADGLIKPSMSAVDRRYASWKKTRKALGYEL